MRLRANDIHTRTAISKLLVKLEQNPEYSRELGLSDTSHFRTGSEAANREKEEKDDVEHTGTDFHDDWAV